MKKRIVVLSCALALMASGCATPPAPEPVSVNTYSREFVKVVSPLINRTDLKKGEVCSIRMYYDPNGVAEAFELLPDGSDLLCKRAVIALDAVDGLGVLPVLPKELRTKIGRSLILDFSV